MLHEVEVVDDDLDLVGNGRMVAQGTKTGLLGSTDAHARTRYPDRLVQALTRAGLAVHDDRRPLSA